MKNKTETLLTKYWVIFYRTNEFNFYQKKQTIYQFNC